MYIMYIMYTSILLKKKSSTISNVTQSPKSVMILMVKNIALYHTSLCIYVCLYCIHTSVQLLYMDQAPQHCQPGHWHHPWCRREGTLLASQRIYGDASSRNEEKKTTKMRTYSIYRKARILAAKLKMKPQNISISPTKLGFTRQRWGMNQQLVPCKNREWTWLNLNRQTCCTGWRPAKMGTEIKWKQHIQHYSTF